MSLILEEDSDHSQSEDGSINGGETSKGSTSRDELAELQKFVAAENKNVGIWRLVVCAVIVVVGIGVTWMTHYFLTVEEKNSFEKEVRESSVIPFDSPSSTGPHDVPMLFFAVRQVRHNSNPVYQVQREIIWREL